MKRETADAGYAYPEKYSIAPLSSLSDGTYTRESGQYKATGANGKALFVKRIPQYDWQHELQYVIKIHEFCIDHPMAQDRFPSFIGWYRQDASVYMVFERIPTTWSNTIDTDEKVQTHLLGLLEALCILHDQLDIIHGDVKPANVLVREDGTVCLTDFGCMHANTQGVGQCSTPLYRYLYGYSAQTKLVDLYAIGMIIAKYVYKMDCFTESGLMKRECEAMESDDYLVLKLLLERDDHGKGNQTAVKNVKECEDALKTLIVSRLRTKSAGRIDKMSVTSALLAYLREKWGQPETIGVCRSPWHPNNI